MGWNPLIDGIKNGEPVNASVTNRPLSQLEENVRYVLDALNASGVGSSLYLRRASLHENCVVGTPVYWDDVAQKFSPALANIDAVNGLLAATKSSEVVGIVTVKHNATLGDILVYGIATVNLTTVVSPETLRVGVYYLSSANAGKLTKTKPALPVPVLRYFGNNQVFLTPQIGDIQDRHTHVKFALDCVPAGTVAPPAFGERHTMTSPDVDVRGWLPANHASFANKAPAGAKFGYNLTAHPELAAVWPPSPVRNVYLEWAKGLDPDVGLTGVQLGANGLCIVDRNGIWWMSDCYGDVPWPISYDSNLANTLSDSTNECPRDLYMEMGLWFTRLNFSQDATLVASLRSIDPRIIVRCEDGADGSTGSLVIDLDLSLSVDTAQTRGSRVLKGLNDDKLLAGHVVEGIYTTSTNVVLSSALTPIKLVADDPASPNVYQGMVNIVVLPQAVVELPALSVRLDGATEEQITEPPVMYIGLRSGQLSKYRCKVQVPGSTGLISPRMRLNFTILGRAIGTMPALTVTARRIPRGSTTPTALPLAAAEFAVTVATNLTLSAANQFVTVTSSPFVVDDGDQVFFEVKRTASDGYAAEVGVLHQFATIANAT